MSRAKLYVDSGYTDEEQLERAVADSRRRIVLGRLESVDAQQLTAVCLRGKAYDVVDQVLADQLLYDPRHLKFLELKIRSKFEQRQLLMAIDTCDKVLGIDPTNPYAIEMKQKAQDGIREQVAAWD